MKLYHSSPSLFYKFRELSHFGSFNAAMSRSNAYDGDTYLYICEVDSSNIIDIEDYGNESFMLYDDLYRQKIISKEDFIKLKNIVDFEQRSSILSNILFDMNINVIRYKNVAEDIDSTSYIVVKSKEINILSIRKLKG